MLFLILCLLFGSLTASIKDPYVLAATEGEPSLQIADSVSAITGDFVIAETDYVVPGIEPIPIRRTYVSGDGRGENGGWEFFPHTHLTLYQRKQFEGSHYGETYRYASVAEPHGSRLSYTFQKPIKGEPDRFIIEFEENGKGIVNTSQGIISGRTHLKNNVLIVENSDTYNLHSGDRRKRVYKRVEKRDRYIPRPSLCLLEYERLPNHNLIRYTYDEHHRITSIKTFNPSGTKNFAWATFQYLGDPEESHDFIIQTSNGKNLRYHFEKKGTKKDSHFYLISITTNFATEEQSEYKDSTQTTAPLLVKRKLSNNHFLKADYYNLKHNDVGGATVNIPSDDHPVLDRVKTLYAPVGHDATEIPTHRFFYDLHRERKKKRYIYNGLGMTRILDAHHNESRVKR